MFEEPGHPVLSQRRFAARMAYFAACAAIVDALVLALGAIGYHFMEGLNWLDATLNSALVMTGNGPITIPHTPSGKLFTIFHALLGVMLFAAVIGVLLVPVFHRLLHVFHMRSTGNDDKIDVTLSDTTASALDDAEPKQTFGRDELHAPEPQSWIGSSDSALRRAK